MKSDQILTAAKSGNFAPPGPVRICSFFDPLAGPICGYNFLASSFQEFVLFRRGRFDREFLNRLLDTSDLHAQPQEGQKIFQEYLLAGWVNEEEVGLGFLALVLGVLDWGGCNRAFLNRPLDTSVFVLEVSSGRFRISTLRRPEVGLEISL